METGKKKSWRDIVAKLKPGGETKSGGDPAEFQIQMYVCRSCLLPYVHIGSQRQVECSGCGRRTLELKQDVKVNRRDLAIFHLDQALALIRQGDTARAILQLEAAIAADPSYNQAHYNLGELYLQSGKINEGIASSRKALELDATDAMAQLNIGVGLSMQGKVQEALVEFDKAVKLDPNNAMARFNRGLLLLKSERIKDARVDWKKYLELEPQSERAPMVRDFFQKFGG